jgi:hypothetical protein
MGKEEQFFFKCRLLGEALLGIAEVDKEQTEDEEGIGFKC